MTRLDASGDVLWDQVVRSSIRWPGALAPAPDGSVVIAGQGRFEREISILRIDPDGALARHQAVEIDDGDNPAIGSVHVSADGGLVVAGASRPFVWIVQVDPTGDIAWRGSSTSACLDCATFRLARATGGGWIGVTRARTPDLPVVVRLDEDFTVRWAMRLLTDSFDSTSAHGLAVPASGGCLVALDLQQGVQQDPILSAVVKIDDLGGIEWQVARGPRLAMSGDVAATGDGGALVVGQKRLERSRESDVLLLRLDASGDADACGTDVAPGLRAEALAFAFEHRSVWHSPRQATVEAATAAPFDTNELFRGVGDEFEPDGSCGRRPVLHEGEPARRDFCDSSEDWFQVHACEGVAYTLLTANLETLADTVIEILAPDCTTVLASDDDGGGGAASRLDWIAPADGRYDVRVRQADSSWGVGRGYDLLLLRDGPGCSTWVRRYGRSTHRFVDLAALDDGTIAALDDDGGVLHVDADGAVIGGGAVQDRDGLVPLDVERWGPAGCVAAGYESESDGDTKAVLIAMSPPGTIAWQRSYLPLGVSGRFERVRTLRDGGLAAVGGAESGNYRSACIMRADAGGVATWQRVLDFGGHSSLQDVVELSDGRLAAAGEGPDGALAILFDATGAPAWKRSLASLGQVASIDATDDDMLVMAAWDGIVKMDSTGAVLWQRALRECAIAPVWDVVASADGGCIVAGRRPPSCSENGPMLAKLDGRGVLDWVSGVGSRTTTPWLVGLAVLADGSLAGAGTDWREQAGTFDGSDFLLRADSDGTVRDACDWHGSGFVLSDLSGRVTDESSTDRSTGLVMDDPALVIVPETAAWTREVCAGNNPVREMDCADGGDDDLDGAIDCVDGDCVGRPSCREPYQCADGVDNDLDALVDCDDPECVPDVYCSSEDFDGDGAPNGSDCEPDDSRVLSVPSAVTRLEVRKPLGGGAPFDVELTWEDQAPLAGAGTTYAIASDLVSLLRPGGVSAGCVAAGLVAPGWSEGLQVIDDAFYYLVRGETACGPPRGEGWGTDSLGAPRPACP